MSWEIRPGSKGEKAPAGNHLAVLVGLFDMGHQWQEPFDKTKSGYWSHRAYFAWELVGEKTEAGANHVIGIDLTMSVDDRSKLYKFVMARTGKPPAVPFNPMTELGQPCFLNVVEKNGYPKVEGVAAVPKGVPVPAPTFPVTAISLDEFKNGDKTIPDWCPWLYGSPLADHIRACREIGDDKPEPRGSASGGSAASSFPNSPTVQNPGPSAGNPAARWDCRDESGTTLANKTSTEVQAVIDNAKLLASKLTVKPAGAPPAQAKPASEYGFINGDVIPW